ICLRQAAIPPRAGASRGAAHGWPEESTQPVDPVPLRAFLLEERACRRRRAARCTACRWSLEKLDVVDGHEAAIGLALGELTRSVAPDALRREMQAGERAQNGARIVPGVAPLIDH